MCDKYKEAFHFNKAAYSVMLQLALLYVHFLPSQDTTKVQ